MRKTTFFALLTIFGIAACQQLPSEEQKLYEEVMTIHDEVMPKTKDIYRKSKAIKKALEDMPDSIESNEANSLISELDAADKSMFDWMAEFKKKDELGEGENYLDYLAAEKIRIQKVSEAMNSSLEKAEKFLIGLKDE